MATRLSAKLSTVLAVSHIWNCSRHPLDLTNDDGHVVARWPVVGWVRLVEKPQDEPAVTVGSLTLPVSSLQLETFEFSGVVMERIRPGDVVVVERDHLIFAREVMPDSVRVLCAEGVLQDGGVRVVQLHA